ncbi:DUF4329 domain-containing protein [Variovorax sp. IB41]|uniref:DUF4329 domain-containing protein n=1 Tax=Variovorax sp. IB41 TaxID=2779370 RepID=UPI0018E7C538|nr:DUF4329 domain-containing protein [Variovorax sp. IB41]MBJ2157327.1 DUF4329 domain-containing protein [Variovorax sp. IB41]
MATTIFTPPPFPEPDQPFDTPEEAARAALQALLVQSIGTRNEFGGVICKFNDKFHVAPYFVGERNSVSPGLRLRNKGCMPVGAEAVAVAYFHTHPNVVGAGMAMQPDVFSDEDIGVANGAEVDAYIGSVSGLFLKFERATQKTYIAGQCLRNADTGPVPDWKKIKRKLDLKYEFFSPSAPEKAVVKPKPRVPDRKGPTMAPLR